MRSLLVESTQLNEVELAAARGLVKVKLSGGTHREGNAAATDDELQPQTQMSQQNMLRQYGVATQDKQKQSDQTDVPKGEFPESPTQSSHTIFEAKLHFAALIQL